MFDTEAFVSTTELLEYNSSGPLTSVDSIAEAAPTGFCSKNVAVGGFPLLPLLAVPDRTTMPFRHSNTAAPAELDKAVNVVAAPDVPGVMPMKVLSARFCSVNAGPAGVAVHRYGVDDTREPPPVPPAGGCK
jgi:hypothetical protein